MSGSRPFACVTVTVDMSCALSGCCLFGRVYVVSPVFLCVSRTRRVCSCMFRVILFVIAVVGVVPGSFVLSLLLCESSLSQCSFVSLWRFRFVSMLDLVITVYDCTNCKVLAFVSFGRFGRAVRLGMVGRASETTPGNLMSAIRRATLHNAFPCCFSEFRKFILLISLWFWSCGVVNMR